MVKGLVSELTTEQIQSLRVVQFTEEETAETIRNNILLDSEDELDEITSKQLAQLKSKSILELVLEVTPLCNAACPICYTDSINIRKRKDYDYRSW